MPSDVDRGDRWAARYLIAVLDRDAEAMRHALNEVQAVGAVWDLVDALGATARDLLIQCHGTDQAREILRAQLLAAAELEP